MSMSNLKATPQLQSKMTYFGGRIIIFWTRVFLFSTTTREPKSSSRLDKSKFIELKSLTLSSQATGFFSFVPAMGFSVAASPPIRKELNTEIYICVPNNTMEFYLYKKIKTYCLVLFRFISFSLYSVTCKKNTPLFKNLKKPYLILNLRLNSSFIVLLATISIQSL